MVLTKSDLLGILIYTLSSIKIPNYDAKYLDNANRKFCWNNNLKPDHSLPSISFISWNKIYRPKCEGGLALAKLQMLVLQYWQS